MLFSLVVLLFVMLLLYIYRLVCQWQLSQFERFKIFYLGVNVTFDLMIVEHYPIIIDRDIVCGCGV